MRKALILSVAVLSSACVSKSEEGAFSFDEEIEKVVIELPTGDVQILGSDRVGAEVATTSHWRGSRSPDLDVDVEGKTLVMRVDCGALSICRVNAVIEVPEAVKVEANGATGDVKVSGVTGYVAVDRSTGSIELADLSGALELETSTGHIEATGLSSKQVTAETSTGSVELAFTEAPEQVDVEVSTGSVHIRVPDETYAVETDTSTGHVSVDVAVDPASERKISAETSTGSVTIENG